MSGLSVATIKAPEFININSINPLISKCEIKVMYVGENRNRSYITKEVATEMAKSLPGTPIVGYYSENKEDFGDHGEQMVIDGDGIKFNCLTKPYGFVDINSKVWFKEFEDTDEFGNKVNREYLMCEGYLWTEQYEEAKKIINEGRPHSMELDEKSLKGHWSTDNNRGIEFFIINDAIFSKLCVLGEDVEPCFEGSSVTAPQVSSSFSYKTEDFTSSLYKMMKELKELTYSLQDKGGQSMEENTVEVQAVETEVVEDTSAVVEETKVEENLGETETLVTAETEETTVEFKKEEKEEEKSEEKTEEDEKSDEDKKDESEEEDKKTKHSLESEYALLKGQYDELVQQYASLEQSNKELVAFKNAIEDKEKDELIAKFYMLSDEDKKNVVENKANFTLDEIEKELSVICVRKKVSFANEEETENKINITSYTVNNSAETEVLPSWLQAVEAHKTQN